MDKPKPDRNLIGIFDTLLEQQLKARIVEIRSDRIHVPGRVSSRPVKMCSKCYSVIDKTWDHSTWCELYEPEKLSEWLKKGKK